MPKANPFAQIAKRLASLQVKSSKINEEISTLVQVVEAEMKKQEVASVPAQVAPKLVSDKAAPKVAAKEASKPVVAKVAPAKVEKQMETPKKKGRPAKK